MNQEGMYDSCTHCKKGASCCSSFNLIDSPLLNGDEINNIKKVSKIDDFYIQRDNDVFNLKTNDNHCIFFINNHCTIYDERPNDCKLYPFDIMEMDNKYYLILYKLDCIDIEKYKMINVDSILNKIKPWIKDYTNIEYNRKLRNFDYIIIKEII